ncbi:ADP-ribosylation factor GTPase-activating protein AGD5-like isoform X1 [Populus alba x Populus x berolinensis]|nr:ADP-ribosylation factor GTPase-activating protein AGD5-like isoform X1 [Populus alba x Populus x berolinensis]
MNEKANVSKELNAKHRKILESLLKLPENRECADCKSKGPRWASVNLGIFICMQCSAMGNERSNNYWEAELPPKYDRVVIEYFIRAKYDFVELPVSSIDIVLDFVRYHWFFYLMLNLRMLMLYVRYEEKRWVPRDGKAKSPSRVNGEKTPTRSSGHGQMNDTNHVLEERKVTRPPITNGRSPAAKSSTPMPVKASSPLPVKASTPLAVKASQKAAHDNKSQEPVQKSEPAAPKAELAKKEESATKVVTLPKVDYATELFNLLCMDDSRESDSTTPAHDNGWASFQTADAKSTPERSSSSNFIESMTQPNLTSPSLEKPLKAVNNDIMNLFNKSSMVSPFSVHEQQLGKMLSQQQQFIMATAAGSGNGSHTVPSKSHRPSFNGTHLPAQRWGSYAYQVPGMVMPITDPQKYMQMGSSQQVYSAGNPINFPISSSYRPGPGAPINGMANTKATMPSPAFPVAPTQPAGYYDLSSLATYTKQ